MPTWKDIFEGVPYPTRRTFHGVKRGKETCHFCRSATQNLQPMDIVRQGHVRRQTRNYYLCCHRCWKNKSFVVYEP
jgi:hypothetical protein